MNWLFGRRESATDIGESREYHTLPDTSASSATSAVESATGQLDSPNLKKQKVSSILRIYEDDMLELCRNVALFPQLETGGDLFGFIHHQNDGSLIVNVSRAIGPGHRSERLVTFFKQDPQYFKHCEQVLSKNHGLMYLGNWHSHHTLSSAVPTKCDCANIANTLSAERSDMKYFIQLLACIDPHNKSISVKPYIFTNGETSFKEIQLSIMPGVSPFKQFTLLPEETEEPLETSILSNPLSTTAHIASTSTLPPTRFMGGGDSSNLSEMASASIAPTSQELFGSGGGGGGDQQQEQQEEEEKLSWDRYTRIQNAINDSKLMGDQEDEDHRKKEQDLTSIKQTALNDAEEVPFTNIGYLPMKRRSSIVLQRLARADTSM